MRLSLIFPLLFVCLTRTQLSSCHEHNFSITTTTGEIRGKHIYVGSIKLNAWYGIPYATPPVGNLRFKATVPVEPWTGIKHTQQQPDICYQTDDSGYALLPKTFYKWNPTGKKNEDCLYLNVIAPMKEGNNFSTIIWFHGGAFYKGSINLDLYNPKQLVARENVIVVQIQYRLGILGFLNLRAYNITGNMGLLDQSEALKWVYNNIEAFGGSRDDITLMGESAGAASVGYHMISNLTRNLFQKVITQSGSPFNYWAYISPEDSYDRSRIAAANVGCKYLEVETLYKCLMTTYPWTLHDWDISILSLEPTIDNNFLHKSPFDAMNDGDYVSKPILGGLVLNEGMPGVMYFMRKIRTIGWAYVSREDFNAVIRMMAAFLDNDLEQFKLLGEYYLQMYNYGYFISYAEATNQIFGDFFINCGTIDFLTAMATNVPVYFYYFNYRSYKDIDPQFVTVMHGSEIKYQFGQPFSHAQEFDDSDRTFSDSLMKTWATFAKTGKMQENWKIYNSSDSYTEMILGGRNITLPRRREPYCAEWRKRNLTYYSTIDAKEIYPFMRIVIAEISGITSGFLKDWIEYFNLPKYDVW